MSSLPPMEIQTLNAGIPNLDYFAYLGVFSSGWWANPTPFGGGNDTEKYYKMLQNKKDDYNTKLKQFWISMGVSKYVYLMPIWSKRFIIIWQLL